MLSPASLKSRQAISLASALLLTLAAPGVVVAADASAVPCAQPDLAAVVESPDTSAAAAVPSRFRKAKFPKAGLGMSISDVIEGGPGFIAVGGGTPTGLDHRAVIWVSDDGVHWQSAPLFGDAAEGTITGVAPLPGGGYVAVGRDFMPQTERDELVHVLVWHSDEGIAWERAAADESFAGSSALDLVATPDGVAMSGCVTGFHCDVGRVWTSGDGQAWELQDEIALAPYSIAATDAGDILIGGEDDAYDLVGGQAAVAASAQGWAARLVASADSQVTGTTDYGDGFAITGVLAEPGGSLSGSAVRLSDDGIEWSLVEPEQLGDGAWSDGISAADDLLMVVGSRYDLKKDVTEPIAIWTRDMESFRPVKFPKSLKREAFGFDDVRLTDDGSMAFVFGSEKGRPAIWYSVIE